MKTQVIICICLFLVTMSTAKAQVKTSGDPNNNVRTSILNAENSSKVVISPYIIDNNFSSSDLQESIIKSDNLVYDSIKLMTDSINILTASNSVKLENNMELVDVSAGFNSIAQALEYLKSNMEGPTVISLDEGYYEIDATQIIDLPYQVTFEGTSKDETTVNATQMVSGNPLFICLTECRFVNIAFISFSNAKGNDAIHYAGSGNNNELLNCYIAGFNKGVVSENNDLLLMTDVSFENCSVSGVEIAPDISANVNINILACDFLQCKKGISLLSGVSEEITIKNCSFYNSLSGSDVGIFCNPKTFDAYNNISITNNAWNKQGKYINGIDFSKSDSKNVDALTINSPGW